MVQSAQVQHYLELSKRLIGRAQFLLEVPLVVADTKGPYVIDCDGKYYLDFISGACTQNLGFDPQLGPMPCGFPFPYAPGIIQLEYAQKLINLVSSTSNLKLTFGVCGSEAIDAAIKYARAYTKRKKIVSFFGDYHGTTFGSCTLTTMPGRMGKSFAPMLPECYSIPFCDNSASSEEVEASLKALYALDLDSIAGVVFESMQGDMGMLPMHPYLLKEIASLATQHGFLMVADEIQLAFFRTGSFFSFEQFADFMPDIIAMGKNLGGGIPLSCVIAKDEIMDSLNPGEHDFTLAGNSEACARGLHNLNKILSLKESGRIDELCLKLKCHLQSLKDDFPELILDYTGAGLAYGLWFKAYGKYAKANDVAEAMVKACFKHGMYTQRLSSSFLRIEPQLNLTDMQLDTGFEIIRKAIMDIKRL